jgi:histidinol-phosphate aminotransferase
MIISKVVREENPMMIHPKARPIISKLSLPTPIQKYFSNINWEIDLSNNTNPHVEGFSEYPDVKQNDLKMLYLNRILAINPSPFASNGTREALTFDNVLFTAGSMEGLDLILRTFAEPNKDVICVTLPSFSAYTHWALIHNLEVKTISLSGNNLDQIDSEEVINLNPKLTFICDPNNPSGTKITPETIQKLCSSLDGFVIVDEAYIEFSDQPSSIFYLNKYENLIILRTFSKAWGLAGVRCGAIIADEPIINALRYVQLPFSFSSSSQEKVEERLLNPEKTFASWQRIKKNRKEMLEELLNLEGVEKVFKSDTNFIMLVLKDFQKTMGLLNENKIHVLDCSPSIPNSIRVSLGTEEQNQKFLEVLRKS